MSENTETLENLTEVMDQIGLVDGVMMAGIVAQGPHSHECQTMLSDLKEGIQVLRRQGELCGNSEALLLAEAEETIAFFHDKYCS